MPDTVRIRGAWHSLLLGTLVLVGAARSAAAQGAAPAAPLPSVQLPSALDRVLRDYEKRWQARDAAALAALFTEDGFVLQSNRPPVRGRAAIAEAYRNSGGPLALRALAYATSDTVGYIIGAFAMKAGGADAGKFTLTLRRSRGGMWLIASDMDNGNR